MTRADFLATRADLNADFSRPGAALDGRSPYVAHFGRHGGRSLPGRARAPVGRADDRRASFPTAVGRPGRAPASRSTTTEPRRPAAKKVIAAWPGRASPRPDPAEQARGHAGTPHCNWSFKRSTCSPAPRSPCAVPVRWSSASRPRPAGTVRRGSRPAGEMELPAAGAVARGGLGARAREAVDGGRLGLTPKERTGPARPRRKRKPYPNVVI